MGGPVDRRSGISRRTRTHSTRRSTPLETMRRAVAVSEATASGLLMKFLFPYEQVRRANRLLSGGERTRLQLLLLMLARPNLLVLDEPTNHLDIESVEVLEKAIEEFAGTVVAISHDRYFLDRIADRIVEVRDGRCGQATAATRRGARRGPFLHRTRSVHRLVPCPGRTSAT